MEGLADAVRGLVEGILPAFRNTNFAYSLAGLMFLSAVSITSIAIVRHMSAVSALKRRIRQIAGFIAFEKTDASGADQHEVQFARRFQDIDTAMQQSGPISENLAQAWRRYRKTFVDCGAPPIRSFQRPSAFFYGAVPPPTWLGLAANTFVGIGLLLTFVGLVAALTFAAEGMQETDSARMRDAIRDLLAAAASKFITSIAGVGISILLSLLERVLTNQLRNNLDALSSAVELGVRVETNAHSAATAERLGQITDRLEVSGT